MVANIDIVMAFPAASVILEDSPTDLQALLDVTAHAAYAARWWYTFNTSKSFVVVFGESPCSHSTLRAQCS